MVFHSEYSSQVMTSIGQDAARRDHWEAQKQLQLAQLTAAQAEQQQHGLSEAQQLRQHCEAKLREAPLFGGRCWAPRGLEGGKKLIGRDGNWEGLEEL